MTIEQTVAILAKEYGFKKSDALKKLKKGDKPKRAKTGYNLFVADERHRIAVANPDDSTQEIMKKVGAAWKALEEAEREEWNNEARIAKTPDASSDEEMEVEEKKEKKEKKPRAKTGYNLFVADERPRIKKANPDDSTQELMKKVGAAWKALEEEKRAEWNESAKRSTE